MPSGHPPDLTAPLPAHAGGRWCQVRVFLPAAAGWWARIILTDPARDQVVRSLFLGPLRPVPGGAWRDTLLHVPPGAGAMRVQLFGAAADGARTNIRVLGRADVAVRLLWRGRTLLPFCLRGTPLGLLGRLRAVLGQAPARAGEAPAYAAWIRVCEASLPPPPAAPPLDIQAAILGDDAAALAATQASLAAQTMPATRAALHIRAPTDWGLLSAAWVVVLRAGEGLAPHALAWFAAAAAAAPAAACITADCDRLRPDGTRADPLFLPGADALLLRSGLPTAGPYALRWSAPPPDLPMDARAARQLLALRAPDAIVHIPRILAHLPPGEGPVTGRPVPVPRDPAYHPAVTALVPTRARSMHAAYCLRRVEDGTSYENFRITVLLSAPHQAAPRVLRRLSALKRVELRAVPMAEFNFAAVNNTGAAATDTDLLLLLNDDVAPVAPGWLDAMVAHMQDPRVGVVGARLLYGNGMVQHEGVILGLADLCEHAGRLRAAADPGPHGIGRVSRPVAAVTAACLLIRASLYRDLGGMDEGFAIALNDVDLCLRARQAGWRIIYCAESELFHYESLSLGRHYGGSRAALESIEVRRLRARWADVIAADPCYNPQASLDPGREWQPAFPPRGVATPPCPSNTVA